MNQNQNRTFGIADCSEIAEFGDLPVLWVHRASCIICQGSQG